MTQLDLILKRQINQDIQTGFYHTKNSDLQNYVCSWIWNIEIWYIASFGSVLILIIFICILSFKLQKSHFSDNYGIQEEMSRRAHVVITLFIICIALYFVFDYEDIREWMITIIMSIGSMLLTVISTGGVVYIQNRQSRVYQKIRQTNNKPLASSKNQTTSRQQISAFIEEEFSQNSFSNPHYEAFRDPNDSSLAGIMIHDESGHGVSGLTASMSPSRYKDGKHKSQQIIEENAGEQLELSQVITNPVLLNVFAQFLCVEFSVENLLFIIEIVQFKRYIKENESDHSSVLGEFINIPQNQDLPHFDQIDKDSMLDSMMTNANNDCIDVYKYGLYIVNKYIISDASHEINISHRVRKCIVAQAKGLECIRKLSMDKLQILFDAAFVEILQLLQDPLSRFASWEEFNVYLKAIGPTAYPFFPRCTCFCFCWCCRRENRNQEVILMDDEKQLLSYS